MKAFDVPTCTSFESIDRYVCTVAQVDILDMHIALDFEIRVYEENSKPQVFNKNKKNDFNRRERERETVREEGRGEGLQSGF